MHATQLHPFSTVTIQENGDATYDHRGAPLQTTPDTTRHALPSYHTMTVTPSDSALGDPSGYVDDSWSYAQTDGERISHSMGNAGFFSTVQPEGTDSSGSPNPNRLCNDESTMKCVNNVDYTPAPTNSTRIFVKMNRTVQRFSPTTPMIPDRGQGSNLCTVHRLSLERCDAEKSKVHCDSETQSSSIGSLKPPDKYLVDGIYSSAGQTQSNTDLRPSWDGELHPTPYGGRNDCSEPSGESSAGPIVTPQGLASPPIKSPLGSSAKPSPSSFPPHCPWGGIFLSDGRKYSCMYALNGQSESQILEHWAREHVANEIFAFRARVITEWDQACFLNTPQKLWTALSHLGICPNQPCVGEIYKATDDREEMIYSHLLKHPECEPAFTVAFTVPPNRGYMDMAAELGYDDPR
ncbi:hypothetical protein BU17DRAFT_64736 [Hysterangium stoloniferum]|nr:hypothetical protein BU17DRAFT_64736 [Hysterangium stoloniferum]